MKSAAHIVALYLQQQGVGTIGGSIFINGEPPAPDSALTIYDTPSDRPRHIGGIENTGYRRQKWRVQVRARHRNAQEAHTWLQQARVVLHLLQRFSPAVGRLTQTTHGAWLLSGGMSLGRDADNRSIVVDNWEVDIGWRAFLEWGVRITEDGLLRVSEDDILRIVESVFVTRVNESGSLRLSEGGIARQVGDI